MPLKPPTIAEREQVLRARLGRFYGPRDVERWFKWRHPQLDGRKAADLIAAGKIEEVEAIVNRLESGAFV